MNYLQRHIDWQQAEVADAYDVVSLWGAAFGKLFFEYVPLEQSMHVLDVGFGTGFPLLELAGRLGPSSRVYGIDPWKGAVARARRKAAAMQLEHVEIVEGDASQMPFEDEQFDMIVSHLGLNNFEQKEQVLAACRRVMKDEARLVLVTNTIGTFAAFYQQFESVLQDLGLKEERTALLNQEKSRWSVARLQHWLQDRGFELICSHQQKSSMRYLDGTAFLNNAFIVMAFLPAWKALIPQHLHHTVFSALEQALNTYAKQQGELSLSVPMVYVEAKKIKP